ncbi:hypothetical protein HNI00_00445 [Thermoleptolyngbya oregonensis NK1-22]|uniref:Uncharacterized protein n=1 Tax=Thermoleptolyngbya oregonensis NK1-22 TaxID=2547457 RepID=A0AA97BKD4_9CYAN|nr:hypothetical protein [Thermoleptolyngbya oregonensis]WOB41817.1 hypothetical protein HNI00_00445 [Thermoleptolyngbya oregonensis NK1-22]
MKLLAGEFKALSESMNQQEIEHRDRVLRSYFEGCDWDQNGEYELKRTLVLNSDRLLPDYPYVVENEWEVEPGRGHKGRGDLVFTDGAGRFAVVEVKCLNRTGCGGNKKAQQEKVRVRRHQVIKQALHYANIYAASKLEAGVIDDPNAVAAYVFTNEQDYPYFLFRESESLQITNVPIQSPSDHREPVAALHR